MKLLLFLLCSLAAVGQQAPQITPCAKNEWRIVHMADGYWYACRNGSEWKKTAWPPRDLKKFGIDSYTWRDADEPAKKPAKPPCTENCEITSAICEHCKVEPAKPKSEIRTPCDCAKKCERKIK